MFQAFFSKLTKYVDWLDGLNKELTVQDSIFYMDEYNQECEQGGQPPIAFPARDYIVQIARFDPSKGIDTVVKAYGELRNNYLKDADIKDIPQLVIAGHSAIDDPDASLIFDEIMELIEKDYPEMANDISVMRLGPIDQVLNVLMSNAKVALQLSTREGFEVKVSEALHKVSRRQELLNHPPLTCSNPGQTRHRDSDRRHPPPSHPQQERLPRPPRRRPSRRKPPLRAVDRHRPL